MIPILDWIFEGVVGWVSSIASQLLDAVSGLFLEALGTDMTAMEEYFPFVTKAYGVMQVTAYAILILIVIWQLFRAFGGPITEAENPWHLVVRGALFGFLIGYAKPIFELCLDIARAPYTSLMDLTMTGEDFTFAGVEQALTNGLVTLVSSASVVGLILILILLIALGWNYFKLLLETVERYVVVGVLCYTSPLAFSMGASKSTGNVFKSWCRMVGSQLLLLVMNVWFLRGFSSSMGQFIGNGGALTTGKGSIFLWLFCALAYLKCAQRFDSYLASMGLNVAQTGSSMGMELMMAARVISGVGSGARSAGSVFGRAGGSATATGTGAAASGFAAGFASRFNPNSYVRDAVVEGGTRMGFSGGAGFVARAFGGIAARNGATLNGQSISSVASRTPGTSGTIAGDIADRSLSNYMPHMKGFQMQGTQISGGHISTTATTPDGKQAKVDMYSASQYEKPDVPHSVVTASDGSQWYQMASGEGRGAFYDAPVFGGMGAQQSAGGFNPDPGNPAAGDAASGTEAHEPHADLAGTPAGDHIVPNADGASQNMGVFPGGVNPEGAAEQPGGISDSNEIPPVPTGMSGGMEKGAHLVSEDGMPVSVPGSSGNQVPGMVDGHDAAVTGVQQGIIGGADAPAVPGEGKADAAEFGEAFVADSKNAPDAVGGNIGAGEILHAAAMGRDESGDSATGAEGTSFSENFVPAENGQNVIQFPGGTTDLPGNAGVISGGVQGSEGSGAASQFGTAVVPPADLSHIAESGIPGGTHVPAGGIPMQPEGGVNAPGGEAVQFGAGFISDSGSGQVHEAADQVGQEAPLVGGTAQTDTGFTATGGEAIGGMQMPATVGTTVTDGGYSAPGGDSSQFGGNFVPAAASGDSHALGGAGGEDTTFIGGTFQHEGGMGAVGGEAFASDGGYTVPVGGTSRSDSGETLASDAIGGMQMPSADGAIFPEDGYAAHGGEIPQFGAAFVPGNAAGQIHETGDSSGMDVSAFGGSGLADGGFDGIQHDAGFVPSAVSSQFQEDHSAGGLDSVAPGGSDADSVAVGGGDTVPIPMGGTHVAPSDVSDPGTASGFTADASDEHSASGFQGSWFGSDGSGGGNANEYGGDNFTGGHNPGHDDGGHMHGGSHYGGYAEAPLVAATFPSAQEGTMLRTVGDGMIEASSPDGGNTLWYNSAFFQEPDAPHSVMVASNGVQWYAMQQQANAPQFESGPEAAQYNQAAFQNFMPGYDGQVSHVDGTHRQDGHFEVRNADGSGTAFYDTARYAAPRGNYQVMEDARGSQWYAIRGEAAVDRRPVYENGHAVYDDGKLRTISVETVRYKQTPARFAEPQKRADIATKAPRRKQ